MSFKSGKRMFKYTGTVMILFLIVRLLVFSGPFTLTPQALKNHVSSKLTMRKSYIPTCTNEQRLQKIQQYCDTHPDIGRTTPAKRQSFFQVMSDDKHKVLYCYIAKTGCTSWKHLMALQSGKPNVEKLLASDWEIVHYYEHEAKLGLRRLSSYSPNEIVTRLTEYTKFMVTRNPLSRLYSAYNDKFIWDYQGYGMRHFKRILTQLSPPLPEINDRKFLSWQRFLEMVVSAHKENHPYSARVKQDEHWNMIYQICNPCSIKYDYIARMETVDDDHGPILALFNATQLPTIHRNSREESRRPNLFNYKKLPIDEAYSGVSNETMQDIFRIYHHEFDMFGYMKKAADGPKCEYNDEQCC